MSTALVSNDFFSLSRPCRTSVQLGAYGAIVGWNEEETEIILLETRDGGNTWSRTVVAEGESYNGYPPCIRMDSAENLHICWSNANAFDADVYYIKRTGSSFGPVTTFPCSNTDSYAPAMSINADGTEVYIVWVEINITTNCGLYLAHYSGGTWGSPVNIVEDVRTTPAVELLGTTLHIVAAATSNNSLYHYTYNGSTLSPLGIIGVTRVSRFSMCKDTETNNLHLAWVDFEAEYLRHGIYSSSAWSIETVYTSMQSVSSVNIGVNGSQLRIGIGSFEEESVLGEASILVSETKLLPFTRTVVSSGSTLASVPETGEFVFYVDSITGYYYVYPLVDGGLRSFWNGPVDKISGSKKFALIQPTSGAAGWSDHYEVSQSVSGRVEERTVYSLSYYGRMYYGHINPRYYVENGAFKMNTACRCYGSQQYYVTFSSPTDEVLGNLYTVVSFFDREGELIDEYATDEVSLSDEEWNRGCFAFETPDATRTLAIKFVCDANTTVNPGCILLDEVSVNYLYSRQI